MTNPTRLIVLHAAFALLALAAAGTQAQTHVMGQHPAVLQQRAASIDANTFIVGHPASPRNRAGHANHDHPAVTLARQVEAGIGNSVDANTFLVQPPASTRWTQGPAPEAAIALLTR